VNVASLGGVIGEELVQLRQRKETQKPVLQKRRQRPQRPETKGATDEKGRNNREEGHGSGGGKPSRMLSGRRKNAT